MNKETKRIVPHLPLLFFSLGFSFFLEVGVSLRLSGESEILYGQNGWWILGTMVLAAVLMAGLFLVGRLPRRLRERKPTSLCGG